MPPFNLASYCENEAQKSFASAQECFAGNDRATGIALCGVACAWHERAQGETKPSASAVQQIHRVSLTFMRPGGPEQPGNIKGIVVGSPTDEEAQQVLEATRAFLAS